MNGINIMTFETNFKFIKMLLIVIGVVGGWIFPTLSFAYPVVNSVDVKILGPDRADYTVSWSDDILLDNNPAIRAKVPINSITGIFGLTHRHNTSNPSSPSMGAFTNSVDIGSASTTWYELGKKWTKGSSGGTLIVSHNAGANGSECVGLVAAPYKKGPWSDIVIPYQGVNCLGTPPADNWCALKTPEITLNYGTLTADNAAGTKKSANVIVECTDAIDYTLRLRGKDQILLTNGMNVTLTANNNPLVTTTFKGTKGDNSVVIEGTLNGTPVDGAFSGSEVLMVSYP